MRRSTLLPLTAVLLAGAAAALPAQAETICTPAPKDQWLTADAIKGKAEGMGLKVRKVKEDDGCWEVYALTADGRKAELHLDPISGAVVAREMAD